MALLPFSTYGDVDVSDEGSLLSSRLYGLGEKEGRRERERESRCHKSRRKGEEEREGEERARCLLLCYLEQLSLSLSRSLGGGSVGGKICHAYSQRGDEGRRR